MVWDNLAIRAPIKEWAQSVLATAGYNGQPIPVAWMNDERPMQLKLPARVELDGPHSVDQVGEDWVTYAESIGAEPAIPDGDMIPTVNGNRLFTVTIRVVSRQQSRNGNALVLVERLRSSLKKPSTLARFQAANLAIVRMSKVAEYDQEFDQRVESIHAVELRMGTTVQDSDSTAGRIKAFTLTSHLSGEDGAELPSPPNVTDLLIEQE